jgi:hypothetical protein
MNPIEIFWMPSFYFPRPDSPDVTWFGPNPMVEGLCLGFDDGIVALIDVLTQQRSYYQNPAKDAINGVAAIGKRNLAISTRSDVTFFHIESPTKNTWASFSGGSHGVVATQSGYFIAPIGAKGLLVVKPDSGPQQKMRVTNVGETKLYFYRMTVLYGSAGEELLLFANRRNGVGFCRFTGNEDRRQVHTLKFEGLDVVDVCQVGLSSLSAVAISPKAEVLWFKDVFKSEDPVAMRLGGVEGQVYRVLATSNHLYVLSSKALYVWANLVDVVLYNKTNKQKSNPLVLPLDAIDMTLYGNDSLLLVMATNDIRILKIIDHEMLSLHQGPFHTSPSASIEMSEKTNVVGFMPDWQHDDVQQDMMAGVG